MQCYLHNPRGICARTPPCMRHRSEGPQLTERCVLMGSSYPRAFVPSPQRIDPKFVQGCDDSVPRSLTSALRAGAAVAEENMVVKVPCPLFLCDAEATWRVISAFFGESRRERKRGRSKLLDFRVSRNVKYKRQSTLAPDTYGTSYVAQKP